MEVDVPKILNYIWEFKFIWGIGALLLSAYAFYITYIKPMFELIENVDFFSVSPPEPNEAGVTYYNVELEIRMRQQGECQFVVKVDNEEIKNDSISSDMGKSYRIYFDLPRKSSGESKFLTIGLRGWPGKFFLTKRKVPLTPLLRRATRS